MKIFSTTPTPHHGQKVSYVLKVGLFSCPVRKVTKIPGIPQSNFTKRLWFLAIFQRPRVYHGLWKIPKPQYFCTVWSVEILDQKVPCPVHKKSKTMCAGFWLFCCCFFVFFCMIWSSIIIFTPPEHRKHHLNLKWGDLIFWFRPISCTHFATPQHIPFLY